MKQLSGNKNEEAEKNKFRIFIHYIDDKRSTSWLLKLRVTEGQHSHPAIISQQLPRHKNDMHCCLVNKRIKRKQKIRFCRDKNKPLDNGRSVDGGQQVNRSD